MYIYICSYICVVAYVFLFFPAAVGSTQCVKQDPAKPGFAPAKPGFAQMSLEPTAATYSWEPTAASTWESSAATSSWESSAATSPWQSWQAGSSTAVTEGQERAAQGQERAAQGEERAAQTTNVRVACQWRMQFLNVKWETINGVRHISEFWNVSRGQMYKITVAEVANSDGWWNWTHYPSESGPPDDDDDRSQEAVTPTTPQATTGRNEPRAEVFFSPKRARQTL
jgi:hypothetical protein